MSISLRPGSEGAFNRDIYYGHYLITIHKQDKYSYADESDINDIKKHLERSGIKFNKYCLEANGRHGQTHMHAMVYYKGRYKPFTSYGDGKHFDYYKIDWKPVKCFRGAIDYIMKNQPYEAEQQIATHYYRYNYGFI